MTLDVLLSALNPIGFPCHDINSYRRKMGMFRTFFTQPTYVLKFFLKSNFGSALYDLKNQKVYQRRPFLRVKITLLSLVFFRKNLDRFVALIEVKNIRNAPRLSIDGH